jgi:hypothetical protein
MKDEVGINKQHLFQCRQIKRRLRCRAEGRLLERSFSAGCACVDRRALDDHLGGQNAKGAVETLLEEAVDRRPSLIEESLKGSLGKPAPEITARRPPVFLEECPELRVPKPKEANVSRIVEGVLGASHALEILIIEPIHVCMRIPRIPRPTIYLSAIHDPEI